MIIDPSFPLPMDFQSNLDAVGIQISADRTKLWLCINGQAFLRLKNIKELSINVEGHHITPLTYHPSQKDKK